MSDELCSAAWIRTHSRSASPERPSPAWADRRKGFVFDSAVHLVGGCEPSEDATGGLIDRILRTVGTRDECEFISVDPFYRAVFPGLVFDAPTKREDFIAAHAKAFPGEEDGIRGFFELGAEVVSGLSCFPQCARQEPGGTGCSRTMIGHFRPRPYERGSGHEGALRVCEREGDGEDDECAGLMRDRCGQGNGPDHDQRAQGELEQGQARKKPSQGAL